MESTVTPTRWAAGMHRNQHDEIGQIAKRHGVKRVKVIAALLAAWKTITPTKQAKLLAAPLMPVPADRRAADPATANQVAQEAA